MIDTHTHTRFSDDSNQCPEELILTAIDKGLTHLAITDHFDRDYLFGNMKKTIQLDMADYYPCIMNLKDKYSGKITILIGAEFGYSMPAASLYQDMLTNYPHLDIIINSVHTVGGRDAYYKDFFIGISKDEAYNNYLDAIIESLDAPYHYDVISHIGYVTRNAPYPDKALYYDDYRDKIDTILKKIIKKGKSLEINTRAYSHNTPFVPSNEVLIRYRELGGEYISFASDAHKASDLGKGYEAVKDYLMNLGYKYLTTYIAKKPFMIKL